MKIKMTSTTVGSFICFGLLLVLISGACFVVYLIETQHDQESTTTTYDVIVIDMETFAYVDADGQIRVVKWVQHGGLVKVFTSNVTYVEVICSDIPLIHDHTVYKLYLNASDLK